MGEVLKESGSIGSWGNTNEGGERGQAGRWLLRADKAFEQMFAEASQDQLVTFTERGD